MKSCLNAGALLTLVAGLLLSAGPAAAQPAPEDAPARAPETSADEEAPAGGQERDAPAGGPATEAPEDGERLSAYQAALDRGTSRYNGGEYEAARQAFVQAAQIVPGQAASYRNLARANFWLERYAEATHHYDHYLRLAPEAGDAEQIRLERRMAATRAAGQGYVVPGAQRQALEALERELTRGQALTPAGGGAYGLYQTVLRMGYAAPELAQIQARLAQRLVDEHDAGLLAAPSGLVPTLDQQDWAVQRERLQLAAELTPDPLTAELVERRLLVVEAAEALLGSRLDRAAERAQEAAEANPDLRFVGWYQVAALAAGGEHERALQALDAFRARADWDAPTDRQAAVLRAQLLQALGRSEEAARALESALRE
ncbi:hypothetical protein DL240_10550 [Lujinxingia litoralis]|uniref:Tetratricopeptide repeat protein n=1 Tax=Lujinxingia litoralis TaxID=2211119 RepID=A0A328C9H4_9DELT|nr:hypothetical protein [Lujinxingia litoralis]RAL22283.1 hypothetical protein DL240_10550 [Lujinxingia litoralis]